MRAALKLAVVFLFLWIVASHAGDTTPWIGNVPAQSRLILESSQFAGTATQRVGVQIKLESGWWTYWRAPGSSGMPPVFDWSGSENLAEDPEIIWPVPLRTVAYGESLNLYKNEVIFPVEFRAADPTKPIKLHLKVLFGVCRNMCVPETAAHDVVLPPAAGTPKVNEANVKLIEAYAGRKPSHDPLETGLEIQGVNALADEAKAYLAIRVKGLRAGGSSLVLVESADMTRVAEVKARPTGDGLIKLLMLKLGPVANLRDLSGKRVRVTVIDGGRALEQVWVVNAEGSALAGYEFTPVAHRPIDKPEPWGVRPNPGEE
jgi:suppressor for copper-sensitivity B